MNIEEPVLGNLYDKYETRNPIARFLFRNFLLNVQELVESIPVESVLEVGCGEGHLTELLSGWLCPDRICGIDLSPHLFDPKHKQETSVLFSCQSAYQLGFQEDAFDLVVGAEVLEHLEKPVAALEEIERVASKYLLLSVPREPTWRILNMIRFAYWSDLGNTPGHLQHWSSSEFVDLISRFFEVLRVRKPLPWTLVLAVKKASGS
jgi:ubiquinone/menaquinone biosynthesis C-methylase UbiE